MNEQKNLFLAIAISIAIILFFQLLYPTPISEPIQNAENEVLAPAKSIDEQELKQNTHWNFTSIITRNNYFTLKV